MTGPQVGWVGETAARAQTNAQVIDELTFPTMELYAMPAATQAFLDDAAVDVGQWIAQEVNAAFAEQETAASCWATASTNRPAF
ncbi:phage major capsid protein, HK97 family [Pelagibacterium luteolum]|uniref:Phage major capsid protein, HK97 family n=1 Tax=Pelagibacterium luteolum TaxID=440168 RepID=A0A1G7TPC5_9HYPH|nr:phage major capsid protein, HK97 family [Pelagibacterium luteolum]